MYKNFRVFTVVVVVALLAVALTPAAQAQSVVTLQLMGWSSSPSENTLLQEIIDGWNKANPNVQVKLNQVPDYDTTLAKALASGEPPDVFYLDSFRFLDLKEAGALASFGDKLTNPDDFYPALRNAFTIENTFYCPPKDFSTLALQINTAMLEKAGLKVPTTWEELKAAAKAMTTADVAGVVVPADFARFIAFLYQAGGSVTDDEYTKMTINSPEGLEALKFYTELVTEKIGKTPQELGAGWPGEAFFKGKAAMAFEGNWIGPAIKSDAPDLKYQVVELPAGPKGKATMAFTVCYAVAAASKNQDAAIKFVDYITGAEGMKAWTDLGLAMPTRASLKDGWLKAFSEQGAYLNGAEYAHKWQFVPGFNAVLDKVNEQIKLIFEGNQLPEDALKEIEKVGNEILAKRPKK